MKGKFHASESQPWCMSDKVCTIPPTTPQTPQLAASYAVLQVPLDEEK